MKFKEEIFSPYIFFIGFILFCTIGLIGKNYFKEYYVPGISIYTIFYIFLISSIFIIGSKLNFNINENFLIGIIFFLVLLFTFKKFSFYSIFLSLLSLIIIFMIKKNYFSKYYKEIYFLGVVLCLLNIILLGKLPLLNPWIRESALNPIFVLGYSFIFISNNFGVLKNKCPINFLFPSTSLFIFLLYGFRTYIVISILSTMITFYLVDIKYKTIYFGIIGLTLTVILGYLTTLLLPQNWKLNPFELLWYRFTFTFDVFDKICTFVNFNFLGSYNLLSETTTGYIISDKILNYSHNITSTIFGPPIFDGGIIEVGIFTLLTSISLFKLYNRTKNNTLLIPYYSLILSIFLVSIEISPYPLILLLIPLSLYISLTIVNKNSIIHL